MNQDIMKQVVAVNESKDTFVHQISINGQKEVGPG